MMHYWGEIPVASAPPGRSSFDLLQREFRQVEMQDPPLHQPSARRPRPTTMLDIPSEPCSLTIHTVQLCQHARRLRSLITAAQLGQQAPGVGSETQGLIKPEDTDTLPPRPVTPAAPDDLLPLDSKVPRELFQLRHSDPESDFYKGEGEPVTELSWPSCRQLLYQSVATVLAHAGFESAMESVLETLTDLVHEHYLRLTQLLRVAVDREARLGSTPFPDVVEQVFHEVGIGSVLALQRFWQVRIKDYHSYMLQVSKELSEEYERLVNPEKALEDSNPLKVKEEPFGDLPFTLNEEAEGEMSSTEQAMSAGVLGMLSERLTGGLEDGHSPHTGAAGNGSPLWQLQQVKMEPQDSEEGQVSGHGVLTSDVFEDGPMSTMSDAGTAPSPGGSDASYGSQSPDSLIGTSPFNQRPKKRMRKV
ncbi:STAGA complex 65 subunit gamma [Bagarius yarrelli]|uniref:STAGA complex 65 subunit gamma n=1 Tax=Bagarius yarrelli TaxID=175774 RepID=A0A556U580_BAGYA|nr:STAGA complex 65 subunit gamma [Bagarius yarrelli]